MRSIVKLCLVAGLFAASPVSARQVALGDGLRRVSRNDVADSENMVFRARHPHLYLSDTGDYDGDGKSDHVVLATRDDGEYLVVVALSSRDADIVLTSGAMSEVAGIAVNTVRSGSQSRACALSMRDATTRCSPSTPLKYDAIEVFTFEAGGELFTYDGDAFVSQARGD